jgi:hypothetical protein
MKLLIRLENGQPIGHPILLENFLQAFPSINLYDLPNQEFAWFERVQAPIVGVYEKNQTVTYQWVGDVVKDVWTVEPMTEAEKLEKQNLVKENWKEFGANLNPSFIFYEDKCDYGPPIPPPVVEGKDFIWDEETLSWKEFIIEVPTE